MFSGGLIPSKGSQALVVKLSLHILQDEGGGLYAGAVVHA